MRLPKYTKDIYLIWRNKKKHHKHIYLRTPHKKVLERKAKEFQRVLRKETNNNTAAFSLGNLIELMTQQCFEYEPEIERHVIREVHLIEDMKHE